MKLRMTVSKEEVQDYGTMAITQILGMLQSHYNKVPQTALEAIEMIAEYIEVEMEKTR